MDYVVYCLYSESAKKIYVGYTSHLINRFKSHNELGKKGYTANYRPWVVVYVEYYSTKKEAMKREKQLKTARGRDFLWKFITNNY